jgi:hypothetical protein
MNTAQINPLQLEASSQTPQDFGRETGKNREVSFNIQNISFYSLNI